MRYTYNEIYAFHDWRKNYNQPAELFIANSFIDIRVSNKWFGRLYKYRYDGNRVRHITLFKLTIIWGDDSFLIDDEDESWSKYKEQYDNKNRKSQ